jgi:hypothetical protein
MLSIANGRRHRRILDAESGDPGCDHSRGSTLRWKPEFGRSIGPFLSPAPRRCGALAIAHMWQRQRMLRECRPMHGESTTGGHGPRPGASARRWVMSGVHSARHPGPVRGWLLCWHEGHQPLRLFQPTLPLALWLRRSARRWHRPTGFAPRSHRRRRLVPDKLELRRPLARLIEILPSPSLLRVPSAFSLLGQIRRVSSLGARRGRASSRRAGSVRISISSASRVGRARRPSRRRTIVGGHGNPSRVPISEHRVYRSQRTVSDHPS